MVDIDETLHDAAVGEARRRWGADAFAIRGVYSYPGGAAFSVGFLDGGAVRMKGIGRSWREAFSYSEGAAA